MGMKMQYVTVFDDSALAREKNYVSSGRIVLQVSCAPAEKIRAARARTPPLTRPEAFGDS